jgi:DNA-directed RNA polymerase specialized sigma24 family protein
MSPLTLRRYRAERLLRQEFEELRGRVMATVRGRLGASGARLDPSDLEACYAQAWQGLYAAVLDGQEIANPAGWLTLVTYRRAIEELRASRHVDHGRGTHGHPAGEPAAHDTPAIEGAEEPDLAGELDDRMRLRHLFEGLRGRLSAREREAAAFCYLQGLSRSEAAAAMDISAARMRKLMDGRGPGRPGVAAKVGALAETIRGGRWCEDQGSLMRGLAYGVLDPNGERYRLALIHRDECPACRAYVVSLRGLAAALPPVLLPWGAGVGALLRAGGGPHAGAGLGAHPGAGAEAGSQAGAGLGGAMSAPGAASVGGAAGAGGAAGGSWLLAGGSLGTKLAVGCVLALGVGAGCVALTEGPLQRPAPTHHGAGVSRGRAGARASAGNTALNEDRLAGALRASRPADAAAGSSPAAGLTPAARAAREFGPEHGPPSGDEQSASSIDAYSVIARQASSAEAPPTATRFSSRASTSGAIVPAAAGRSASRSAPAVPAGTSAAEREFGIG